MLCTVIPCSALPIHARTKSGTQWNPRRIRFALVRLHGWVLGCAVDLDVGYRLAGWLPYFVVLYFVVLYFVLPYFVLPYFVLLNFLLPYF
jgi:hypothetical protein